MRALPFILVLALAGSFALCQARSEPATFEVASVKPSQHTLGPDYNNQITYTPAGIAARNITLKSLIAEAYRLQLNQISGPDWLDGNEYEIQAKASSNTTRERVELMLQNLLSERFSLKSHDETRAMRVYALTVSKSGAKIHQTNDAQPANASMGFHFHGDMREFADLLAIKLSMPPLNDPSAPVRASGPPVPVLDKTGLTGVADFTVSIQPELGTDPFTLWQRALQEQLGLRLENRKEDVRTLVVDNAAKVPTEN